MYKLPVLSILTCISTALLTPASAQEANNSQIFLNKLLRSSGHNQTIEDIKNNQMQRFESQDIDEIPGVSKADIELARNTRNARNRANTIAKYLTADMNGDGMLTETEVRQNFLPQAKRPFRVNKKAIPPTPSQIEAILEEHAKSFWVLDTDEDRIGSSPLC